MLFAYVVFFLLVFWRGISVEVSVDRITILPALPIFSIPTILCLTQAGQLFQNSARLKLVSVPFSSLVLDIGHLEKLFPESIM